jgi:hypothetical protein
LYTESIVDFTLSLAGTLAGGFRRRYKAANLVVLPGNSELNNTLWNRGDFEGLLVLWVLFEQAGVLEG